MSGEIHVVAETLRAAAEAAIAISEAMKETQQDLGGITCRLDIDTGNSASAEVVQTFAVGWAGGFALQMYNLSKAAENLKIAANRYDGSDIQAARDLVGSIF